MTDRSSNFVERQSFASSDRLGDGEEVMPVDGHDDARRDGTPRVQVEVERDGRFRTLLMKRVVNLYTERL